MTLMDSWDAFKDKYISRSAQPEPKNAPKADPAFQSTDYAEENRKFSADYLTPVKRRKTALAAPLYIKGIDKKGADTFRAWFRLEKFTDRKPASVLDQTIIRLFNRRSNIKSKLRVSDRASHIYGDGFILINYINDNTSGEKGSPDLSLSPDIFNGTVPYNLQLINPENLVEMKWKSKEYKANNIKHFYYRSKDGVERWIHPDRILHVKRNALPFSRLGISDMDMLVDILNSYSDINIATGEILKWFSHGIQTVSKDNMGTKEREIILKELAKHNNVYANDSKFKFDVVKPEAIDPKEFYVWIVRNIAGIIGMPTHMLIGLEIGKSYGAESGYTDYYRDVKDDQELLYTPLLNKLYSQLLISKGRDFDKYEIIWNQIYVDEKAEADIDKTRAESIEKLKNVGIIDTKEARQIYNKGHVDLDEDKKPKVEKNRINPLIKQKEDKNESDSKRN